jgi:hypothetical protein
MARNKPISCGKCGAKGVKIYRPYGFFYRPEDNRCNNCVTESERNFYVPCVKDSDGMIWGYGAVSPEASEQFYNTPEANASKPIWLRSGPGIHEGFSDREKRMNK